MTTTTHDPVHRPKHYTSLPGLYECWAYTQHMSFSLGNAFKYVFRYAHKNGLEDLNKASWYLDNTAAGLPHARCRWGLESILDGLGDHARLSGSLQVNVLYRIARLDAYGGADDWKLASVGLQEMIMELEEAESAASGDACRGEGNTSPGIGPRQLNSG
jgi:hypothetical protein